MQDEELPWLCRLQTKLSCRSMAGDTDAKPGHSQWKQQAGEQPLSKHIMFFIRGGEVWTCGERWLCPCFSHTRNNRIVIFLTSLLWWKIHYAPTCVSELSLSLQPAYGIKPVSELTHFDSENRGIMFLHSVSTCLWFHMMTQCRRLFWGGAVIRNNFISLFSFSHHYMFRPLQAILRLNIHSHF
jgi:hypothetical protein